MTNAEAIAILKTYDVNFYNDDGHKIRADKICEALDMAIQALEQEPSVSEKPNNCEMRDATLEERESIDKYIKSISKPTGVKFGALEQEPSDDCISRQAVLDKFQWHSGDESNKYLTLWTFVENMPSVKPQERTGHCKDCKYFEYDSVARVDGIPLIVAHEICNKWGDGCKTREDGYCFLFEPKMSEEPTSSKPEISSYYGLKSYVRERSE